MLFRISRQVSLKDNCKKVDSIQMIFVSKKKKYFGLGLDLMIIIKSLLNSTRLASTPDEGISGMLNCN